MGDGTEYKKISNYVIEEQPQNVKLMKRLPKEDYDTMVAACDIGMIFLDHRFTIPNFPSRLLSYMQAKIPVLACTDTNTDIGKVIEDGGFGWWCESREISDFDKQIDEILKADINIVCENEYEYLIQNYSVKRDYEIISTRLK